MHSLWFKFLLVEILSRPAFGKKGDYCHEKKDHFISVCLKRMQDFGRKTVHAMAELEGSNNDVNLLNQEVDTLSR